MLSQKELQISGIKNCLAVPDASGSLGLSLTRSPCDVYPWVRAIQPGSSAERAGILVGDYLIRVNNSFILYLLCLPVRLCVLLLIKKKLFLLFNDFK